MTLVQFINRALLLAVAPFAGVMLFLLISSLHLQLPALQSVKLAPSPFLEKTQQIDGKLEVMSEYAVSAQAAIQQFFQLYEQTLRDMDGIGQSIDVSAELPAAVFDKRFQAKLGGIKPVKQATGTNVDLQLYALNEPTYRGYALKARMKTDKALRMVLGRDMLGGSETTLEATKRTGAVAGINAGGFADDPRTGKRFPLSTTMLGGKYVYGFFPTNSTELLSFIGFTADRQLIGGRFVKQSDLDRLKPSFGASFVPILLKNGTKQEIPPQWRSSPARAARTVISNFKNDQLLILVTDAADERGGSGATLMELQDKLISLGIKDAYNLDGGGSSSLIFDGQVINRPSDGRLRLLPTHFLFFK